MTPLVELSSLSTSVVVEGRSRPIVEEVDLGIARGEIVGLVGESGSGKSMTARSILRLLPANAIATGRVLFDGVDVLAMSKRELRRLRAERIAMVFQDPRSHVDPLWSVGDFLTAGLRVHRGLGRRAAMRRAHELLSQVGITDPERVVRGYPGQLSGGMLQRVMIATGLSCDPQFIIADEPTTALDVTVQREIMAILKKLCDERGLAMLFVTHDLELAGAICDRVAVMYAGRVVEDQHVDQLFAAPRHPYSAALLAARPRLEGALGRLTVIRGRAISALEAPTGCPFHPRCQYVQPECTVERPPLASVERDARTACRRATDIADQLRTQVQL